MRIAFDLDGTLIDHRFEAEERNRLNWRFWEEQEYLRKGIRLLASKLLSEGHELWVYTSSYRSKGYIRRLFKRYHIRITGIVNQPIHLSKLKQAALIQKPSKYPPMFRIDLLIEDQRGVLIEGNELGFSVIIVDPHNPNWHIDLIQQISRFEGTGDLRK